MEKVLVTGSAGFIGFSVCNKLLDLGIEVHGVDNLNNYYDKKVKIWSFSSQDTLVNFDIQNTQVLPFFTMKIPC